MVLNHFKSAFFALLNLIYHRNFFGAINRKCIFFLYCSSLFSFDNIIKRSKVLISSKGVNIVYYLFFEMRCLLGTSAFSFHSTKDFFYLNYLLHSPAFFRHLPPFGFLIKLSKTSKSWFSINPYFSIRFFIELWRTSKSWFYNVGNSDI